MADIFVSYASEDRSRTEPIAKALEEYGWSVWWDRTIPPGKTFDQVIEEAITAAKCVVVLWSEKSIKSDWVKEEATIGKRRRVLVPAKIDPVEPPLGFGLIQAADLTDWKTETSHAGFAVFLSAISEIVGAPGQQEKSDHLDETPESSLEQQLEIRPKKGGAATPIPHEPEPSEVERPQPKPDSTVITETSSVKPRKTSNALKFGLLAGVTLVLIAGISMFFSQQPNTNLALKEHIVNNIGMKFVLIPAGNFKMGSMFDPSEVADRYGGEAKYYEDERPQHSVEITKPFYLQSTEVTQGQWKKVMESDNTPSHFKECGDDCPVDSVSWYDAQDFIKRLNQLENTKKYRLPTEAEWEYACRAGTTTAFSFGDELDKIDEYAWYKDNSASQTHPVRQKKPNDWDLYDMHGNIKEWCYDWYAAYDPRQVSDPSGPDTGYPYHHRVLRGGSWKEGAQLLRSSHRRHGDPNNRYDFGGFRVAMDL